MPEKERHLVIIELKSGKEIELTEDEFDELCEELDDLNYFYVDDEGEEHTIH